MCRIPNVKIPNQPKQNVELILTWCLAQSGGHAEERWPQMRAQCDVRGVLRGQ